MRPMLVAELSGNHLGSLDRALKIAAAAARSGADALKLQTWEPSMMVLDRGYRIQAGPWAGRNLYDLYEAVHTPKEWHKPIFDCCAELGIECFSSAFDRPSVDFLETLNVKRHKVASFELVDLDLIRHASDTGKPLILSTGMATQQEIDEAELAAESVNDLTMLRCVSGYPSQPEEAGLDLMVKLRHLHFCKVGLSDHTLTDTTAIAATALGASMIEKHFTLSRAQGGPDAAFSLEPEEFRRMANVVRETAAACDPDAKFGPNESEKAQVHLRRSLWWSRDLPAGHIIQAADLVTARPALGLPPNWKPQLIGRTLNRAAKAGTPVQAICT